MIYYRVKKEYDQRNKNEKKRDGNIYIGGELYTMKEAERQRLNLAYMDLVEIKKSATFWSFGARFEAEA